MKPEGKSMRRITIPHISPLYIVNQYEMFCG